VKYEFFINVVGPTGFEPMTYGYLHPAPELSHPPKGQHTRAVFLEPVVLAWLDYDPTCQTEAIHDKDNNKNIRFKNQKSRK
jgi:hypothetical protein